MSGKFLEITSLLPLELRQLILTFSLLEIPDPIENYQSIAATGILKYVQFKSDIEIHIINDSMFINSVFIKNTVKIQDGESNKYLNFFRVWGIDKIILNNGFTKGSWMSLLDFASNVSILGLDEKNPTCLEVGDRITSIIYMQFVSTNFLLNNLNKFSSLKYISLWLDGNSVFECDPRKLFEKLRLISSNVSELELLYDADAGFFSGDQFDQFKNLSENTKVSLMQVEISPQTSCSIETVFRRIFDERVETLCVNDCFDDDMLVQYLPKFSKLQRLELRSHSNFQKFILRSHCLTDLQIISKDVEECDFSGLTDLKRIVLNGNVDSLSFNSIVDTVKELVIISDQTSIELNSEFQYKLPRDLVYLSLQAPQFCHKLDLKKCTQLDFIDIDFESLSSELDDMFWDQIPETVKSITISYSHNSRRDRMLIDGCEFTVRLNDQVKNIEIFISTPILDPLIVFVTKKKANDMNSSDQVLFELISEELNKPYCIIHNISKKVTVCGFEIDEVTIICPEDDIDMLSTKYFKGGEDMCFKETDRLLGCIVYTPPK